MSKRTEHIAQLRKQAAFHRAQAGFSYQRIYALEDENKALRGKVAALRARVVVLPDFDNDVIIDTFRRNGFLIELGASYSVKGQIAQLLNALEELARLNGKAVSEGLLRSSREAISEYAEGIRSLVRRVPGTDQRLAELDQCIADLSELLGEGKEHE